jgi:7,8-dihydro-6-hydroxymethylpterin-pyrophosphokinase
LNAVADIQLSVSLEQMDKIVQSFERCVSRMRYSDVRFGPPVVRF